MSCTAIEPGMFCRPSSALFALSQSIRFAEPIMARDISLLHIDVLLYFKAFSFQNHMTRLKARF